VSISTQQIHTVLRTYNKQLKLSGFRARKNDTPPQSKGDKVTISNEGKQQQIYKQEARQIVEKLKSNPMMSTLQSADKKEG
jgi:hypothetical protein